MKLLFDQNLPRSLVALCAGAFADLRHLKDFGLTEAGGGDTVPQAL